jgi:hypothetical protein
VRRSPRTGSALDPSQARTTGRILVASAGMVFFVGMAAWQGFFALTPHHRELVTTLLVAAGLADLGLGIYFLRKSR